MHLRSIILISSLFVAAFGGQQASKPATGAATPTTPTPTKGGPKIRVTLDELKFSLTRPSETPIHSSIKLNSKDSKVYDVDKQGKIEIKFDVMDEKTKQAVSVQQAFVAFVHKESGREVIFIAEPQTGGKTYAAEIDMKTQAKTFGNLDGIYTVRLLLGDTNAANAIDWTFADVKVAASTPVAAPTSSSPVKKSQIINYEPLPEIKHLFREPEKRPPQFISDTFTLLCIAPMVLLFIMWFSIGLNFENIQISLWSLGFHLGLFGIFALYFTFWVQLNMFDTLKYLGIVGVPTFFFGNRLLRSLNATRRNAKVE